MPDRVFSSSPSRAASGASLVRSSNSVYCLPLPCSSYDSTPIYHSISPGRTLLPPSLPIYPYHSRVTMSHEPPSPTEEGVRAQMALFHGTALRDPEVLLA